MDTGERSARLEIRPGAPVQATDGVAGQVREVVVSPREGRVVALVELVSGRPVVLPAGGATCAAGGGRHRARGAGTRVAAAVGGAAGLEGGGPRTRHPVLAWVARPAAGRRVAVAAEVLATEGRAAAAAAGQAAARPGEPSVTIRARTARSSR